MKRILPIFFSIVLAFTMLFSIVRPVFAAAAPFPSPDVPYTDDPEVNFVGKTAARSVAFLNWTLENYEWACYIPAKVTLNGNTRQCDNADNPLRTFWITISNIVFAFFALIVLITAFVLIITRGKSLTIQRFLPRFIAVVLLVAMSYSIIEFIYTTTDVIQGFFLTKPAAAGQQRVFINATDLLYVGWDYQNFRGLRKVNPYFDESVFVNLLLARLTAVTYYAMTGVLIIRKIILWFFIVLSPVFPVLLLYYPVRNTAKIWIGEFFRWLLYAPLFSIFLSGLVTLWKSDRLPLIFNFSNVGSTFIYPTATNVLLGGPGQVVTANNNINTPDTFALYVVALIMLWVVVLLPFILLQIFLDYLSTFSFNDSPAFQKLLNTSYMLINKPPPLPSNPVPPGPLMAGAAKALPFAKYGDAKTITNIQEGKAGEAMQIPLGEAAGAAVAIPTPIPAAMTQAQVNTELLNATNISLPTIRDIATYEKSMLTNSSSSSATQTYEALRQLANPEGITNEIERNKFVQLKERLMQESKSGNQLASSILTAVNTVNNVSNVSNRNAYQTNNNLRKSLTNIANPQKIVSSVDKEKLTQLHDSLVKESEQGNTLATSILSTKESTSKEELEKIRETLREQGDKGDILAQNVLSTAFSNTDTERTKEILQQVANPSTVTNTSTEREQAIMTQLHDSLVKESEQGNTMATTILAAKESTTVRELQSIKEQLTRESVQGNNVSTSVLATSFTKEHESVLKNVLAQVANPAIIPTGVDKERLTELHDSLVKESEQGNTLATSILSTKETSTSEEIHDLKEQLIEATLEGNQSAASILNTAITRIDAVSTQHVMQQLSNPSTITNTVTREKFEKVKDKLVQAQQQGNQFATSMLAKVQEMPKEETGIEGPANTKQMEDIKTQLLDAKDKGEPLAEDVLSLFSTEGSIPEGVLAPQTNRIQSVSLEDYESVKKMWQENFKDLDVPEGVTSRQAWINREVNDIDEILGLLTSNDQEKVQEGMQEVGNVLPFLMLGGFSQDEIVSYLKAKKEAGKTVLEEIVKEESEEDTLVSVEKHTTTQAAASQHMAVDTSSEDEGEEVSTIQSLNASTPQISVNTELLQLTNLPMPTMRDVVKFEVSLLSKDANKQEEVSKVKDMLTQIANPNGASTQEERDRLTKIQDVLIQNSKQGDQLASNIINAINHIAVSNNIAPIQHVTTKQVFQQLANPTTITNNEVKERMTALHDKLATESQNGNQLASAVLNLNDSSTNEDIQKVKEQMLAAKEQDPLASDIASLLPVTEPSETQTGLPQSNRVQSVSVEDYEAVRQMWEENYKNVDIPAGVNSRDEWIKHDVDNVEQMINLLSSNDVEQVKHGMQEVGNLLPFLMLGGFSQEEIVSYLKAKKEAGKSVLQSIQQANNDEETMVSVESKPAETTAVKEQAAVAEIPTESAPSVEEPVITETEVKVQHEAANKELLDLTKLPVPTLKDLVNYETGGDATADGNKSGKVKVQEILKAINNPDGITDAEEKTRVAQIAQTLQEKENNGDEQAKIILAAAKQANETQTDDQSNPISQFHTYLLELVHPEQYPASRANEQINQIHNDLAEAVKKQNILADRVLIVNGDTPRDQIADLRDQIHNESEAGNPLAQEIWESAPKESITPAQGESVAAITLPESNPLQIISLNDYEDVRNMWEDYYRKADTPKGMTSKNEWLEKESENMRSVMMLLTAEQEDKVQDGLRQVTQLLPFILLGGFTRTEISSYLDAKIRAANSVLQSLPNEEDTMVEAHKDANTPKEKTAEETKEEEKLK